MFPIDLTVLIKAVGLLGIFGIVFAESGLFIGFFLPGDSLLFTAGFLASQGYFNILALMSLSFVGAVLGDSFGYAFGRKAGPLIFSRENSLLFHRSHLERARVFYERYGGKAIIIARFMPAVRTFAPILAGVGRMNYSLFLTYNLIGAAAWGIGVPLAGYFLGSIVPNIDRYIIPIVGAIIVVSFLPVAYHIARDAEHRGEIKRMAFIVRKKILGI